MLRFRFGRWLAEHTQCTKEAWAAWLLISVSWSLRGVAVFLLLNALSMPGSFVLAFAIGLAMLDLTFLITQRAIDRLPQVTRVAYIAQPATPSVVASQPNLP